MKHLKDTGLDDNTIVVFTTDNGAENFTWPDGGQTPFAGGKGTALEGGFRVPAIVVSPWTAGGYVCSDALDHTSLIRIIERRFGVIEPNISAWRRQTMGDFTSVFQNLRPQLAPRAFSGPLGLGAATNQLLTAQEEVARNPAPTVPATNAAIPTQGVARG